MSNGEVALDSAPLWTTDPAVGTRIREEVGDRNGVPIPVMTIPELMAKVARKYADCPALIYEDQFDGHISVTFSQYEAKVHQMAKVFIKLGLKPHHSVGVLAANCPEWFYSELGAICGGGLVAGIYTTNSEEAVHHVLLRSRANIVIVEDAKQLEKVVAIKQNLPELKAIVQIQAPFASDLTPEDGYYRWWELVRMDVSDVEEEYQRRQSRIRANEAAVLIFTVGDKINLPFPP